ncbi:MAG: EutN/CcmL family microcompartment protein [Bacillota bacterium]
MLIGKVIGTVIATRKDEALVGAKLLITQPLDMQGKEKDSPIIAVDTVGAGVGEVVIYVSGSVAPFAVRKHEVPVDAAIVGIVDKIDLQQ